MLTYMFSPLINFLVLFWSHHI